MLTMFKGMWAMFWRLILDDETFENFFADKDNFTRPKE